MAIMINEYVVGPVVNFKRSECPIPMREVVRRGQKAESREREVVGVASVFGNVDDGMDVVAPYAFAEAEKEFLEGRSRCRFLWNHSAENPPVALITDIQTISKSELPASLKNRPDVMGGLLVTRKYFTDEFSERIYQGVTTGAIGEMSFKYHVLDFHYEEKDGQRVRVLDNLALFDLSDVNWGMNSYTLAVAKGPAVYSAAKIDALQKITANDRKLKELQALQDYNDPQTRMMTKRVSDLKAFQANLKASARSRRPKAQDSWLTAANLKLNALRLNQLRGEQPSRFDANQLKLNELRLRQYLKV